MRTISQDQLNVVSGGGLPAVLVYAAARKAISVGVKKYAKQSAAAAGTGAVGGATTAILSKDDD